MKKGYSLAVVFMALALAVCSCNVPGKPATDNNDSANEVKEQTVGNEDVKPMAVAELKMAKDFTLDDIKGKKVNWKNTVESMGMKWIQVSDLKGGESPVVRLYNVQSIPHILVIDSEGRILSEGLTGTELEEFIADHIE